MKMHDQPVRTTARSPVALALAALVMLPIAAVSQTPRYSVRNLGTLVSSTETDSVAAMSSDGTKVVGPLYYKSGNSTIVRAYYWDGTMHDMGGLYPGPAPISVTPAGLVLFDSPASVWTLAGGKVLLPFTTTPGGGRHAYAMNDAGEVAGVCDNPFGPLGTNADGSPRYTPIGVRWARNSAGQWTFTQLPPLAGHNSSQSSTGANAIDQSGNIIGVSWIFSLDGNGNVISTDPHLALWSPSDGYVPHDLGAIPYFAPTGVDSRTDAATLQTQFLWNFRSRAYYSNPTTASTTELLGFGAAFPFASAKAVNVMGQVAGTANFASGSHASYWDTTFPSGVVMDLGVLSGTGSSGFLPNDGGWWSGVDAPVKVINDGGFIVGFSNASGFATSRAFLSTPASRATSAKLLDLNNLLSNTLSSVGLSSLTSGHAINNAGFIVCNAYSVAVKGGQAGTIYQRVAILTRVQ